MEQYFENKKKELLTDIRNEILKETNRYFITQSPNSIMLEKSKKTFHLYPKNGEYYITSKFTEEFLNKFKEYINNNTMFTAVVFDNIMLVANSTDTNLLMKCEYKCYDNYLENIDEKHCEDCSRIITKNIIYKLNNDIIDSDKINFQILDDNVRAKIIKSLLKNKEHDKLIKIIDESYKYKYFNRHIVILIFYLSCEVDAVKIIKYILENKNFDFNYLSSNEVMAMDFYDTEDIYPMMHFTDNHRIYKEIIRYICRDDRFNINYIDGKNIEYNYSPADSIIVDDVELIYELLKNKKHSISSFITPDYGCITILSSAISARNFKLARLILNDKRIDEL